MTINVQSCLESDTQFGIMIAVAGRSRREGEGDVSIYRVWHWCNRDTAELQDSA